jgi:hypothetical protein
MRNILVAMVIAVAAVAPAAAVQTVTFTSAGIYNPGSVNATFGGNTKSELAAALHFTGTAGGAAFDAIGFCVDLSHNIFVNIGSQFQETLNYTIAPLSQDGAGNGLTDMQVHEISGLAALGFKLADAAASDVAAQLAAIQQAIWTIEYPTATFVATGDFASAQAAYSADYVARAPQLSGLATNLVSLDGVQGQITNITGGFGGGIGGNTGAVPEPAVWLEMLAGFSLVGALTRRRNSGTPVVAA